ncbi:MAG: hypothetical protein IJK89_03440 [Clostridia bacterium]|nr:hypothetical protein [Clostridia bacterium]
MKNIMISDQTLRMLAEGKTPLLFREKTAVAAELKKIGVDRIELPPVKHFKEDRVICSTIASAAGEMGIAIPAGDTEKSVDEAWQCVSGASRPCLIVELPVSTLKMEYTYHLKDKAMLKKATELIAAAKALCPVVEFAALDATRADPEFLTSICKAAQTEGASSVCLCDDDGCLLPEDFGNLVSMVKQSVSVPVYVRCSDALSLASANAVAAVRSGADGLKCACTPGGGLATDNVSKLLKNKGEELGAACALDSLHIHSDIASMLNRLDAASLQPTTDANDGETVYLDEDSTIADVSLAAQKLGYELTEEDLGKVLKAVKQVCERKSTVGKRELEALIASYAMQAPSAYHLESYLANCGNKTASLAHVTLLRDGQVLSGVSDGDGPIDASFRAIEQAVGCHFELDDFQIQAVTEGKEALGAALVKLRNSGKLYSGNGISTDIVGASIRAYLNALNKIVFEENG